jgi:hypothetical protein
MCHSAAFRHYVLAYWQISKTQNLDTTPPRQLMALGNDDARPLGAEIRLVKMKRHFTRYQIALQMRNALLPASVILKLLVPASTIHF